MTDVNESQTSSTLLRRIKDPHDREAWEQFVDRYAPQIYTWCLRRGLQNADAEDVTQNVLSKLYRGMRRFDYERSQSFYGYLRTATTNALKDYFAAQAGRITASGDSAVQKALNNVQAREALFEQLDENFVLEIFEEARFRVRQRVTADTWQIYQRLAQGERSEEVASLLNKNLDAVYKAKSRVEALIRDEVKQLGKLS